MRDITSKESYRRQFEAIQHCFRIIGFTNKVHAGQVGNEHNANVCRWVGEKAHVF